MRGMLHLVAAIGAAGLMLSPDAAVSARPYAEAEPPRALGRLRAEAERPQAERSADRLEVGRLLVASREVRDATFERAVVLLFIRSEEGTAGLIVNRPTTLAVDRFVPDLPGAGEASPRTFFGGPVAIEQIRGLLRMPVNPVDQALPVLPGLFLLPTAEALAQAAAEGVTAAQLRLYYGYAGWGPGQLENEIRRGDWHVTDGDASIVFDPDPETIWYRHIRASDTIAA